jgi:epoxide hydrolase-like predicted phosphatase
MATIEAVLFDYGGVFTVSPFAAVGDLGRELGTDPELLVRTIFGPYEADTDHPWHRLERGETSLRDASKEIIALGKELGIEANPVEFFARMASGSGIHQIVVDCVRRLRGEGYRTALVTNNAVEFRDHWRATLPLDELFHEVIDSSEEGVRKPDPRIYEVALERLGGIAPERAVFLDDYPGNVEAAERVGMHGVLVGPDPSEAIAVLDGLLGR